jgi:hypothetical protein
LRLEPVKATNGCYEPTDLQEGLKGLRLSLFWISRQRPGFFLKIDNIFVRHRVGGPRDGRAFIHDHGVGAGWLTCFEKNKMRSAHRKYIAMCEPLTFHRLPIDERSVCTSKIPHFKLTLIFNYFAVTAGG